MKKQWYFLLIISILLFLARGSFAQEDTWTRKADMPTARWGLATAVVDWKIYAIGGMISTTVEEYDPVTDTWERKNPMQVGRNRQTASVVNGKIYVIGGWNGEALQTVEEYSPETDTWVRKTDMPTARYGHGESVVNGKIYVIGGYTTGAVELSTVEEYDPATDKWKKKADMPTPRGGALVEAINGIIYAMGGFNLGGTNWLATNEMYDPSTDTWANNPDMHIGGTVVTGGNAGTSIVNGKLYATALKLMYEYDPETDTASLKTSSTVERYIPSASAVNGYIYVIGGAPAGFISPLFTVEAYNPGVGIQAKSIAPQEGSVTGGDYIVIIGRGFPSDVTVTIDGRPLTQVNITDTLIAGVTPPGTEGEHNILLTSPSNDFIALLGHFFYKPLSDIVVTTIMPTNGKQAGGDLGSITGSGFLPGAMVTIGGNSAAAVGVTPALITFKIPPGMEGAKDVVVTNPDGQRGILRAGYTYNPFPIIKRITPDEGRLSGNTQIIITGSHFMQGAVVAIGDAGIQQLDLFSTDELHLKTPSGLAGTVTVKVTNPDGQVAIMEDGFTYNPAPIILSIKPDAGSLEGGTAIVIIGRRFLFGAHVLIGGVGARPENVKSETMMTAVTPPSDAGVKDVVVVNSDGQKATLKDAFTYNPAPVITGVTPNNGRLAGGTEITIRGSGFLPGAKVLISTSTAASKIIPSSEVMSSAVVTAIMPPDKPGPKSIIVRNTDMQSAVLENGFTYNLLPTIISITPNYGSSSGGTKVIIEGTGFLQGATVMIGELPATTQVKSDTTIEATSPSFPQGVWDVRVVNPDTQEVVMSKGFISVGEVAYNYPNPFRASQGTTFRYVTGDPVQSITVKIFNLAGVPIDVIQQTDSNEVKWHNAKVRAGLYVYLMEIELEDGKMKQFRSVLEVYK